MSEIWLGVEDASRDCKCRLCNKTINAGEKRVVYKDSYFGSPTFKYYHPKCAEQLIKKEKKELDKVLKEIKKTS